MVITKITNALNSDIAKVNKAIENVSDYVSNQVNQFFFKPTDDLGVGGVRLDLIGEQTLSFKSDVTDHYVESNTAYQDQISLPPMTYTIQGEVGELVYYNKDSVMSNVGYVNQKLSKLTSFAPSISRTFNQISDKALKVAGWVDSIDNIVTRLSKMGYNKKTGKDDEDSQIYTQQQIAYMQLVALRNARQPINVTTPWTDLVGYVITDVTLTQPSRTKDKSTIRIGLKEFRTTTLTPVKFNKESYQGRAGFQRAPEIEQGQTTGDMSVLYVSAGKKTYTEITR